MKIVTTDQAPPAGGHYSQAVTVNGLLFVSGQLPLELASGKMVAGGIEVQAVQALTNLGNIVKAAGYRLDEIVKVTVFVNGIEHWPVFNRIYAEFFGAHKPARSVVPCSALHYGALVEIEAIAAHEV
jgi:reactive intermediate/imine deaminase